MPTLTTDPPMAATRPSPTPRKRPAPPALVTAAALQTMAESLAKAEAEGATALQAVADKVIRRGIDKWAEQASAELAEVCNATVTKAVRGWKRRRGDLYREVSRAVAGTHTEALLESWASAVIAQVEAQVDDQRLISTDVLESITFTLPAQKGKPKPQKTNALDCLDTEFLEWFMREMSDCEVDNTNRLMFRMLLVGALDWMRDAPRRWREPGPDKLGW